MQRYKILKNNDIFVLVSKPPHFIKVKQMKPSKTDIRIAASTKRIHEYIDNLWSEYSNRREAERTIDTYEQTGQIYYKYTIDGVEVVPFSRYEEFKSEDSFSCPLCGK